MCVVVKSRINPSIKTGSGNKTSIPVAIRFNANEESVEDVTKASESLSSSPIHGNVSLFFHCICFL